MAYKPTLLTQAETVELTGESYLPPCDVGDIRQIETTFANGCIGWALYDALVADLADYSAALEWDGSSTALNGVRLYKGAYYKAKTATTNEPTLKTDWELAPKFQSTVYNDLWCNVLGRHLALLALQVTMTRVATPTTGMGNIKRNGAGFEAADRKANLEKYVWIAAQVLDTWDNLEAYMKRNSIAYSSACTASQTACCIVDEHYLQFGTDGTVSVGHGETSSCTCPTCRQKQITHANRYVIA